MWKIGLFNDERPKWRNKKKLQLECWKYQLKCSPLDDLDGTSLTTSNETLLLPLSFFTLFWCLKMGLDFFCITGEFDRLDDMIPFSKRSIIIRSVVNIWWHTKENISTKVIQPFVHAWMVSKMLRNTRYDKIILYSTVWFTNRKVKWRKKKFATFWCLI